MALTHTLRLTCSTFHAVVIRPPSSRIPRHSLFDRRGPALPRLLGLLLLGGVPWTPQVCRAGGGPENLLLVVNRRSWTSVAIANHYQHLRGIPPGNVLNLDWAGSVTETDVETFRSKILFPIVESIERRRLTGQIDYVVYSSDFPYSIDITADLKTGDKFAKGSLTGLTYLAPLVLAKTPAYTNQDVNWYWRRVSAQGQQLVPTRGFRFANYWNEAGEIVPRDGMRYLLSVMLGYTSGRGNSLTEVLDYLTRNSQSDGSSPEGTIYYARNENIRSNAREYRWDLTATNEAKKTRVGRSLYELAVTELKRSGVSAQIVSDKLPTNRTDVAGAMLGIAKFDWSRSGSQILPGAICENFTSFGGILSEDAGQTPLTDLLRFGAAGSSGTVVEPYAIWQKFPHPFIHVHYARGCSLAEAFYQSVSQPYQLLVMGDPLCQPWARPPQVIVAGIKSGQVVTGKVRISARVNGKVQAKYCDAFVDGRHIVRTPPNVYYELDTETLPDGHHELRVVAVADNLIECQGRQAVSFTTKNHARTIVVHGKRTRTIRWDKTMRFDVESPGAVGIAVYVNREVLARAAGDKVRFVIKPSHIGLGPARLSIVGLYGKQRTDNVFSQPVDIEVTPPKLITALRSPVGVKYAPGMRVTSSGGPSVKVTSTFDKNWPEKLAHLTKNSPFAIEGLVNVRHDGVYQLQAAIDGDVDVSVNDRRLFATRDQTFNRHYVMLPLSAGWHHIRADARPNRSRRFELKFGDRGCRSVGAPEFFIPL
jgi:hypothetical protein